MSFISEFRDFAVKGNVMDLAIGVIIGGAFGKIVTSFVEDIITPALLNPALEAAHLKDIAELSWHGIKYGSFLSAVLSFTIIALVLFSIIKGINRFKKAEKEAPPAAPSNEEVLLAEIRDELKRRSL